MVAADRAQHGLGEVRVRCAGIGGHVGRVSRRIPRQCQWSEFIPFYDASYGRPRSRGSSLPTTGSALETVSDARSSECDHDARGLTDDEKHLAKLGYKQDLNRSWSGFSNFAISFSIISILAGCFTNFGAGFNNGGPISISWSWPILGVFILIIGFTMSELVSAYPTVGRHLLVGLEAGRPGGRLLHRLAEPDRPGRRDRRCRLRLRDVHRPDDQHVLSSRLRRRLLADAGLHHLRGGAGPGRACSTSSAAT